MNPSPGNQAALALNGQRKTRRHSRRWLPYVGALTLAVLLTAGLWPQPTPVEITRAALGALRATVSEEGRTRVKHRYTVAAPVAGLLRRIPFKAGAPVVAGQTVLAIIDPLPSTLLDARTRALALARRDTAYANLEKARAADTFAASELRRFEKLYADKTISVQELETAQWRATTAARDEAAADSTLRQAEAELAEFSSNADSPTNAVCTPTALKAPASGRVLRVFEESARVVTAGTPLLEVGDPADLEVVVEVLSRDGALMGPGTKVELEQWGGEQRLLGLVRLVEPAGFTKISALGVEEQRVNVIADLLAPPEQRPNLGDGFRVEACFIVWETNQALKVPAGALFRRGQQWTAFVVEGGRARLRAVKVGRSSNTETQILDGLKEGEEVILYPGERVKDGSRIRSVTI